LQSFILLIAPTILLANNADTIRAGLIAMNPNHPLGIFLLHTPYSFNSKAQSSIDFSYSAGNTWRPTLYLLDSKYGTKPEIVSQISGLASNYVEQFCEISPNYKIPEHKAFREAKIYRADGVIHRYTLGGTVALGKRKLNEMGCQINFYNLTGGGSFFDFPVRDATIEQFHKVFTPRISDPFNRQLRKYNQAQIRFTDSLARQSRIIQANDFFRGVFGATYRRYFSIYKTPHISGFANAGLAVGIPLNTVNRYISGTIYGSSVNILHLKSGMNLIVSTGLSAIHHRLISLGKSLHFFDNNMQFSYTTQISLNWHFRKKISQFEAGMEFYGESNFMNLADYTTFYETTPGNYPGLQTGYKALGERNNHLFVSHNQYLALYVSHTSAKSGLIKGFKFIEDGSFARSPLFVPKGANAQDVAIEIFVVVPVNVKHGDK